MWAGHRGVFGDGHRRIGGTERHVRQRYRLGDVRGGLRPGGGDQVERRNTGESGKSGQRQGGGDGAARDDQGVCSRIGAFTPDGPRSGLFASLKAQLWQWSAPPAAAAGSIGSISLDRRAEPRQRRPQFLVLDVGEPARDPRHGLASGPVRAGARSRRDSGACRIASRPTALQPKKRLTRCRMVSEACCISRAIGPSTRNTRVAGCSGSPSTGRGHWIFNGSEWRAISVPAISRPADDQFARGEALLGIGIGKHVAEQDGKRLRADRTGLCHGRL